MTAPDGCRTWRTKSGEHFRPGDPAWCSTHQQWHDEPSVTPRPSLLRRVFAALHSGGADQRPDQPTPPATT